MSRIVSEKLHIVDGQLHMRFGHRSFSQWARNAAHALMAEDKMHGNGSRLWWLPPSLIAGMRTSAVRLLFVAGTSSRGASMHFWKRLRAFVGSTITHPSCVGRLGTTWGHQYRYMTTSFSGIAMDRCRWCRLHFWAEGPLLLEAKFVLAI